MNITAKTFLFATSAICGIGLFAAQSKADDEILDLLNDSPTKSPDITWQEGTAGDIEILGKYYKYAVADPSTRDKYITRQEDTLSGKNVTGDFIGISVVPFELGAAVYNDEGLTIKSLTGDFVNNSMYDDSEEGAYYAMAGAIYNDGDINHITGNFIHNYVQSVNNDAEEGVMYNSGIIQTIHGDYVGNYAKSTNYRAFAGVISNFGSIDEFVGDFVGNYAEGKTVAYGGVFVNTYFDEDYLGLIDNLSASFYDNYAKADAAFGGAIDNAGTINMVADGQGTNGYKKSVVFKGNYIQDTTGKQFEAIYQELGAVINFASQKGGEYTFYDYTSGDGTGTVNFVSDNNEKAQINLYNDIKEQENINFQNKYVLNMISPRDIHANTLKSSIIQAQNITISQAIKMAVDVDLGADTPIMDHFVVDNFSISGDGAINITQFNIVTNAAGGVGTITPVVFVDFAKDEDGNPIGTVEGLDNISSDVKEIVNGRYTYSVVFNAETGEFEFTTTNIAPEPEPVEKADINVAAIAKAAAQTITETLAFQVLNRDVTAIIGYSAGDVQTLSAWVQAFGSNDDVDLKHLGGTIDTQFHGLVGGIDSKRFVYRGGLQAVYGVYGAYVKGKQKIEDTKVTQNSGYLGISAAFRKGIVFNNVTLNGGYLRNEADTEFGNDKFDTKVVSITNKTGADFTKCDLTITPALTLGYMGIDTDDYTAKSGTRVENDYMNVFMIAPEIKLTKDFYEGLKGYAKVAYKMFFYDDAKVKADSVLLPGMSVNPYVEYGVGIIKDWSQEEWNPRDATSYAELTRHDGGREGWDLNLGLKLDF